MSYTQLTEVERYQIYAFLKGGYTQKKIANELGRNPSTISRELKRNAGLRGYRPKQAQCLSHERQQRHRHTLITHTTWQNVEQLLCEDWSPEQIKAWLLKEGLQSVSPEWIYQYIQQCYRPLTHIFLYEIRFPHLIFYFYYYQA